jgi:hypothetical protein
VEITPRGFRTIFHKLKILSGNCPVARVTTPREFSPFRHKMPLMEDESIFLEPWRARYGDVLHDNAKRRPRPRSRLAAAFLVLRFLFSLSGEVALPTGRARTPGAGQENRPAQGRTTARWDRGRGRKIGGRSSVFSSGNRLFTTRPRWPPARENAGKPPSRGVVFPVALVWITRGLAGSSSRWDLGGRGGAGPGSGSGNRVLIATMEVDGPPSP